MARPTIYFDKFTPEKEKEILAAYKKGGSTVRAATILGIHCDTLYDWLKQEDKKKFSDTIKYGKCLSQIYDEDLLDEAIKNKDINAIPLMFKMKCKHRKDYGEDKSDVQVTNNYYDVNVPKRLSEEEWKEGVEE